MARAHGAAIGTPAAPAGDSFSVALMARETRDVLKVFTRHYAALGAEDILLYVDGPTEPADGLGRPVDVTALDAAFWDARGGDPGVLESRQRVVYRDAAARCRSDWLLIVDADEFLIAGRPLGAILARLPAEVEVLRIANAEAVWGPGDAFGTPFGCSYLRHPTPPTRRWRRFAQLVYGRTAALMERGVVGHASGKQMLRRGARPGEIQLHTSFRDGTDIGRWASAVLPDEKLVIAHFDALSVTRWSEKFRRRYSGEAQVAEMRGQRAGQMELLRHAAAQSEAATARLCRKLYGLNRAQAAILRLAGLVQRCDRIA